MHQKSWIRAGRAKRGGQGCARERRLILPFLAPPPPLLLSPCSCFPVFISIFLREVTGYVYLSISSPLAPSLTSPCAAFAVQSFFPSFYLSSQRYSFFCLSLRDGGAEAFFGLAFAGIKNIRGSFHPSNPSIYPLVCFWLCLHPCLREGEVGSGCAALFPSLPARDWSVRSCVRAVCCVSECVLVIGMLMHLTVC
jgi:hypothetical protein